MILQKLEKKLRFENYFKPWPIWILLLEKTYKK